MCGEFIDQASADLFTGEPDTATCSVWMSISVAIFVARIGTGDEINGSGALRVWHLVCFIGGKRRPIISDSDQRAGTRICHALRADGPISMQHLADPYTRILLEMDSSEFGDSRSWLWLGGIHQPSDCSTEIWHGPESRRCNQACSRGDASFARLLGKVADRRRTS